MHQNPTQTPTQTPSRPSRKIFISTGEVSGDWHGADLIEALYRQADTRGIDLEIVALGGDRMAQTPARILTNTAGIGSIGAFEALPHVLPTLWLQHKAKQELQKSPPDLVVLIDYMMPNQGMGWFAKQKLGVPVVYYIAPQEWVWRMNDQNTQAIKGFTDRLFAIFPAEAQYYDQSGVPVEWVGHPFMSSLRQVPDRATVRQKLGISLESTVITLLPASRPQELQSIAPILCHAARLIQSQVPHVQFWIPLSRPQYRASLQKTLDRYGVEAHISEMPSQWLIKSADLVLSKSGTANLETAILDVPQVVCYRIHPITAFLAKYIMRLQIPFACPANLVLMRALVPEFLQEQATGENVAKSALELLTNQSTRAAMLAGYQEIRQQLEKDLDNYGAIDRVAKGIFDLIS